jgi:SEC-C motif
MFPPIARNDPCPCGSGSKFKRCCLTRLDALAKLRKDDERVGCALLDWAECEHHALFGELLAASGALALRYRLNPQSQQSRMTWAITDAIPADGGPPLAARYAQRVGLDQRDREIARRLADAHPRLYQVHGVIPGLWIELAALDHEFAPDGRTLRVFSDMVSGAISPGQTVLARVIDEAPASFWGPVSSYPADALATLRALLRGVDITTAEGSLQALNFDPDGYVSPIPDGLALRTIEWGVDDDADVGEQLEDSGRVASLGVEAGVPGEPWAFAWLDVRTEDAMDLGGWGDDGDGLIEVARIVLHRDHLVVSSTSASVLGEINDWLAREIEGLTPALLRAA